MIGPAHGAYQRHAIPPAGPAGEIHGTPAEDRPAPSPRQVVHRTTAPPSIGVYVVGDTPPATFAGHIARRDRAARAERWRDRLHGAGIAIALAGAMAAAYAAAQATAGPIRPHVAAQVEHRP